MRRAAVLVALGLLVTGCAGDGDDEAATTTTSTTTTTTAPAYESEVYADPAHWLCRGDVDDDPCDRDMDATVVNADGTTEPDPFQPVDADDPDVPDCFYVYPTVSLDQAVSSDLEPHEAQEILTVRHQAARLGEVCRVFAPVYRQTTMTFLLSRVTGQPAPPGDVDEARGVAYGDVLDAFRHYLANDNDGRGVVLVGHSQGTGHLARLLAEEVDTDEALREKLISALLLGGGIDADAYRTIPPCEDGTDTGCVVSFARFRSTAPPPEGSIFGRTENGLALCSNPAALLGDADAPLHPYFASGDATLIGGSGSPIEWATGLTVDTPFVTLPDLLTAECTVDDSGRFSYLAVEVHGDPADPRVDDIRGDLTPEWGLHLIDAHVVMGDLVALVAEQAEAYADAP